MYTSQENSILICVHCIVSLKKTTANNKIPPTKWELMMKVDEIEEAQCFLAKKHIITIFSEWILTPSPIPREENNSQLTRHIQITGVIS